jgi:hypothetical protein
MYALLWSKLPGGRPLKIVQVAILVILFLTVCLEWVFPWIADNLLPTEATVSE